MRLIHHSSDCDQITSGDEGSGFRMNVPAEELAQATGFRPGRPARVSGEQWTMENIREPFNGVKKMSIPAIGRGARREKMGGPGYAEVESGRE